MRKKGKNLAKIYEIKEAYEKPRNFGKKYFKKLSEIREFEGYLKNIHVRKIIGGI